MQALPPTHHVNILAPSKAMAMSGNVLPIPKEPLQESTLESALLLPQTSSRPLPSPRSHAPLPGTVSVSSHLVLRNIKLYLMYFYKPLCSVLASRVPHPSVVPAYRVKRKEEPPSRAHT